MVNILGLHNWFVNSIVTDIIETGPIDLARVIKSLYIHRSFIFEYIFVISDPQQLLKTTPERSMFQSRTADTISIV